jgi:hypothetical protein
MARDETARERDNGQSLLNRRSYLGLMGAAAATVAGGAASASAAEESYDTLTVSSGQTHTIRLGDGDSLENKLIDITASGAAVHIRADGADWTVRNVAVKGQQPTGDNFLMHAVGHGECRIENCYFGDGGAGTTGDYTGLFVNARHSGDLLIRNCNFSNWKDNAVYASPPGNPNAGQFASAGAVGQNGTVRVEDSYFDNNHVASVRLGSEGSYAKNCVVTDGVHRGFWAYWDDIQFENCHSSSTTTYDAGEPKYSDIWGSSPTAELVDCCGTGTLRAREGATIDGDQQGNPRTDPPEGVPMSPKEAVTGQKTSSSDGSDTTTSNPAATDDGEGTLLELVAGPNTSNVTYEFTVEGRVDKRTSDSDTVSESNDTVTDTDDGTVTVSGTSGNGYGDAFYVDGVITSMDLDESDWTLRYDGREVAVQDVEFPNKLVIDGSNRPNLATDYTFAVNGSAQKSPTLGSMNRRDTVSDGEISGRVIGGKDAFRYTGDITAFSIDGPANVDVKEGV